MSYPYTLIMLLFLIPISFAIAFYWAIKSLEANRNATKCLALKIFAKKIKLLLYLPAPILMFFLYGWIAPLNLGEDVARTAIFTIAGVVGGIIAIVFSMMLLIIGRIASKYSSKFLHYVPHNKIYVTIFIYSATLIMACVFPLPLPDFYLLRIILSAFVLFLGMLVLSFKETIRLMNPRYSILDPEVHNIKKWLNKEISKTEINQTKIIPTVKARSVPDDIEKQLEEKMLPIRDIIIRSISSENLQEATDSIDAFTKVALAYLESRRNFYDENDKFIYFVYTEFQNIASSATQTKYLHLRLHPVLIDSLQKISEKALEVHVGITSATSTNNLIVFPTKQIQQLCLQNLNNQNSFAPTSACAALEQIGLKAIKKGFVREATSITEKLSLISDVALFTSSDLYFLSQRANTSIMKIAINAAQKRFVLIEKEYSEFAIETIIDKAIKKSLLAAVERSDAAFIYDPLEPFMCQLYEISMGGKFSLPFFIRSLIYGAKHPWLINKGLEYIENNIYFHIFAPATEKISDMDNTKTKRIIDSIYLSQLIMLSALNPKLRMTLLGNEAELSKIDINGERVIRIFTRGIEILWAYFKKLERRQYSNDHTLDAIFSLLIIGLSVPESHMNHIKALAKKLYQDYCLKPFSSTDTFFKYCRMLNQAAKAITGENENILDDIPKYEEKPSSFPDFEPNDKSLPLEDHSERAFFYDERNNQQWKIMGTHTIPNKFFNDLNNQIWQE